MPSFTSTLPRAAYSENISFSFPKTSAPLFSQLSWQLHQGQCHALIGASASGKTTFLKLLVGLLSPSQGHCGLWPDSPALPVGMVFQRGALFDSLTVAENLAEPFQAHPLSQPSAPLLKESIDQMLQQVGLAGCQSLSTGALSGGMKKRLAIARALITQPCLLICDEPTAGLDPVTSRNILQLLQTWQQRSPAQHTLLIASADPGYCLHWSHHISFLSKGQCTSFSAQQALQYPLTEWQAFLYG